MPQSDAKRRAYVGSLGTGDGKTGHHTKYDPTNHGVILENVNENPNIRLGATTEKPITRLKSALGGLSLGPTKAGVDPLSGEPHTHDDGLSELKGVAQSLESMTKVFASMLVELAAFKPSLVLSLEGNSPTQAGKDNPYYFMIDQKKVPALNIFIFNNTAVTIYVAFSEPATANDIPIPVQSSMTFADIKCDEISVYAATAVNVSRLRGFQKPTNAVIIYGWGNPEWRHFWGQI